MTTALRLNVCLGCLPHCLAHLRPRLDKSPRARLPLLQPGRSSCECRSASQSQQCKVMKWTPLPARSCLPSANPTETHTYACSTNTTEHACMHACIQVCLSRLVRRMCVLSTTKELPSVLSGHLEMALRPGMVEFDPALTCAWVSLCLSEATSWDWVAAAVWVGAAAKRHTVTRRDHIKVLGVATGKTANSPHPAGMFRVFGDIFRSFRPNRFQRREQPKVSPGLPVLSPKINPGHVSLLVIQSYPERTSSQR